MLSPLCTRGAFSLPRCIEWAFSEPLCQDCTLAASGGAGAPRVTTHQAGESMGVRPPDRHAGPVPGQASGAAAPDHNTQLNHLPGFTIPPAWLCHAVPPLHKGGFSLPCGIGPAQRSMGPASRWVASRHSHTFFAQANTTSLTGDSNFPPSARRWPEPVPGWRWHNAAPPGRWWCSWGQSSCRPRR